MNTLPDPHEAFNRLQIARREAAYAEWRSGRGVPHSGDQCGTWCSETDRQAMARIGELYPLRRTAAPRTEWLGDFEYRRSGDNVECRHHEGTQWQIHMNREQLHEREVKAKILLALFDDEPRIIPEVRWHIGDPNERGNTA